MGVLIVGSKGFNMGVLIEGVLIEGELSWFMRALILLLFFLSLRAMEG